MRSREYALGEKIKKVVLGNFKPHGDPVEGPPEGKLCLSDPMVLGPF